AALNSSTQGTPAMSRYTFILVALVSLAGLSSGGCRSCSSCHDYDPPVASCPCGYAPPCGCNGCGYAGCGECGSCSACGSCNSCGGGQCGCNGSGPAYAAPSPSRPSNMSP